MERRNTMSRRGRPTNNWTPEDCKNKVLSILTDTSIETGLSEKIFNSVIGLKLRQRRLELGLNQTKTGKKIGVTFQQVQKYENGLNGMTNAKLWKFSTLVNTNIDWFFEDFKDWETVMKQKERI
tara:strand:+ start:173 stop:544 length:372 start_codon:yes stop_codon:yes gene_type:complete